MRRASLVRPLAGAALALGLSACTGPAELSLGTFAPLVPPAMGTIYIAPNGSDTNPGTHDLPLKRFDHALPLLQPGWALVLLDGQYDSANGPIEARCDGVTIKSGTDDTHRITVTAEHERAAWLRGDGARAPLLLESCAFWTIAGLHVESSEHSPVASAEAASVVVLRGNNHDLLLSRLLLLHPNPSAASVLLRVGDGASHVLVEECELYDFHYYAVYATRGSDLTFRRNYVNSRDTPDKGYVTEDASTGDVGFVLEELRNTLVENNIVENVHDGFGLFGRSLPMADNAPQPVTDPIVNNRLLGNIVLNPAGSGFRIDSRCKSDKPCPPTRTIVNTELRDDVVIGGSVGVSSAGAINTQIRQLSVIGAANGMFMRREPQNGGLPATSTTANSLVAGFQNVGFDAEDEMQSIFDHCAASGGIGPEYAYRTVGPVQIMSPIMVAPDLGSCLAYLPATSPLKQANNGVDVGANVIFQYVDGQLTTKPQWPFPCGATAPGNDTPDTSCSGVEKPQRLNVGTLSCPLP